MLQIGLRRTDPSTADTRRGGAEISPNTGKYNLITALGMP
jgi:hypothetical protein